MYTKSKCDLCGGLKQIEMSIALIYKRKERRLYVCGTCATSTYICSLLDDKDRQVFLKQYPTC